jgi:quercetin 2,3-dioxygenase
MNYPKQPILCQIPAEELYVDDSSGHVGHFHFAYGDYVAPSNEGFGVLDALNDFIVLPGVGFGTHRHEEVEIVSYCVQGELSHSDSMGNTTILRRGDVGYQCAGAGITHAEMNHSPDEPLRFVQILIRPNAPGLPSGYRSQRFSAYDRHDKWLRVASGAPVNGVLRISQDADIFVSEIDEGERLTFAIPGERQVYLVCLEGSLGVNGLELKAGGAIKAIGGAELLLEALEAAHLLMVQVAESQLGK